jgi:hypothetical protein
MYISQLSISQRPGRYMPDVSLAPDRGSALITGAAILGTAT